VVVLSSLELRPTEMFPTPSPSWGLLPRFALTTLSGPTLTQLCSLTMPASFIGL
jgi:hypothetical protein